MDSGVFYAIGNSFPVGQTLDVGMSLPQATLDTRELFPKLVSGHEECLSPLLILLDVRDVFPLKGSSLLLKLYDVEARSSVTACQCSLPLVASRKGCASPYITLIILITFNIFPLTSITNSY